MRINNLDTEKAGAFVEEVKTDPQKAVKTKEVEGEWFFEEGKPQFRAAIRHGSGSTTLEADGPDFLGGSFLRPDPMQYCLFGIASCYAQTLASVAAEKGMKLSRLRVAAENKVNLRKALGLGSEPIVESVRLKVTASGSGNMEELARLAEERCPAVYCLKNPIKVSVELAK
ncbi:MAG: OsmC family protein [Candidatus Micrarchaeota archaeon]